MHGRLPLLVLILLNLLLFVWHYQLPESPQPTELDLPPLRGPDIRLLSEMLPGSIRNAHAYSTPQTVSELTPQISNSQEYPVTCVSLGPLPQQQMAIAILTLLENNGHSIDITTTIANKNTGFWVTINTNDHAAAVLMAELNSAGIVDVWRFAKGPLAGMLSLGLYSSRNAAEKRRSELVEQGFKAEVQTREVETSVYWLNSRYVTTNPMAQKTLDQVYEHYPHLTFPPPPCNSK